MHTPTMTTLIRFSIVILPWVFPEASATETSCSLAGSHGHIVLPDQHHTLTGHSFLNRPRTVRIRCMILCPRNTQRQLNDSSKSTKQDSSNQTKQLTEGTAMVNKTEQGASKTQTSATTERFTAVSKELSTITADITSAKAVDTEGPIAVCPLGVFGLTNDSNALTSLQWSTSRYWRDIEDDTYVIAKCSDEDKVRKVSGDYFKVGSTKVTCTAWDSAGNTGQCTFQANVTVCNMTRLGMESGAIADRQITAKNVLNDDYANYGPALARLNSNGSWCGVIHSDSWIQVDFGRTVDLYALIIQGRYQTDDRVIYVELTYSNDGNTWMGMTEKDGSRKIYSSYPWESDGRGAWVFVQTTSQRMIRSRFIRLRSTVTTGANLCMRFELISCN